MPLLSRARGPLFVPLCAGASLHATQLFIKPRPTLSCFRFRRLVTAHCVRCALATD